MTVLLLSALLSLLSHPPNERFFSVLILHTEYVDMPRNVKRRAQPLNALLTELKYHVICFINPFLLCLENLKFSQSDLLKSLSI